MLTLDRLKEMSRAETVIIEPGHETNCTHEEWRDLVEAARAWKWLDANRRSVAEARGEIPTGCRIEFGGTTLIVQYGRRSDSYPHESLRAAVLAALGKGVSDG